MKDANGCEKLFGPFEVRDVTATKDVFGLENFDLVPNPVQGQGRITIAFDQKTDFDLSVTDAVGKVFNKWHMNANRTDISLDVSTLEQGLYLVVLKTDKGVQTRKWMVVR